MSRSDRRFLVVVRAGELSLHRKWLSGGRRNWDLFVSWYGDAPYAPASDERWENVKGGKCNILFEQFTRLPELTTDYDYIWMPDDDLDTDSDTISTMFDMAAECGFAVCQPSLTPDSYFSYMHTVQSRSFSWRYTSLVEVMAGCLSREALLRALPYMEESVTGYGLDVIWSRLEDDNWERAAILDAIAVRHTRPVGRYLKARAQSAGHEPWKAGRALAARFGIRPPKEFHCYGGVDAKTGKRRGRFATWLHMFRDYRATRQLWVEPTAKRRFAKCFFRRLRWAALSKLTLVDQDRR